MVPRIVRQKVDHTAQPRVSFEWHGWRNNPLTVQVGVFQGAALADLSDVDSISVLGRASLYTGTNIFLHTVESADFETLASAADWTSGTAQHATFQITGSETNRAPVANAQVALHVAIFANLSDGREITLAVGKLIIREDNNGEGYPPEENASDHQYVFGVLSERKTHLILHDADGDTVGWVSINALPLPTEAS